MVRVFKYIPEEEIMAINPERFKNDQDGPCHTPEQRKRFWTDVITSLQLGLDLIAMEARLMNEKRQQHDPANYIKDLDERIEKIKASL